MVYHRFDRGGRGGRSVVSGQGYTYRVDHAAATDARKRAVAWLHRYLDKGEPHHD
jgi:hypothetical protein